MHLLGLLRTRLSVFGLLCSGLMTPLLAADLTTTADTYIQSDSTTNFGSNGITAVAVGRTTLIQFDPTAIAQSSGGKATLKIKVLLAKNFTDGVSALVITSPWNEHAVTARTLPSISANVLDSKIISATNQGQVVTFNVTGRPD
jgi:hypothetical protein